MEKRFTDAGEDPFDAAAIGVKICYRSWVAFMAIWLSFFVTMQILVRCSSGSWTTAWPVFAFFYVAGLLFAARFIPLREELIVEPERLRYCRQEVFRRVLRQFPRSGIRGVEHHVSDAGGDSAETHSLRLHLANGERFLLINDGSRSAVVDWLEPFLRCWAGTPGKFAKNYTPGWRGEVEKMFDP